MAKTDSNDLQDIINQLTLFIETSTKNKGISIYFDAVIKYIENTLDEWASKNVTQERIIEKLDTTLLANLKEHVAEKRLQLTKPQMTTISELIGLLESLQLSPPPVTEPLSINTCPKDIDKTDQPMPFGIELRP